MKTYERPHSSRGRRSPKAAPAHTSEKTESSSRLSLVACSLCLRVRSGSVWIEAREAIRKLRSFELAAPPHLAPGVCDRCTDLVRARRGL